MKLDLTTGRGTAAAGMSTFWDGRLATLEEQARAVILNPKEMAGTPEETVKLLEAENDFYPPKFKAAVGDESITFDRIAQALAPVLLLAGSKSVFSLEDSGAKKPPAGRTGRRC